MALVTELLARGGKKVNGGEKKKTPEMQESTRVEPSEAAD